MRKAIFTALVSLTAATAGAQTMYDGLTFSQNNYYGTARSIGMGNAMTAVGGDLGSIGINPAGSAVAGYSQFTITPNLTISSMSSSYSAYPINNSDIFLNERTKNLARVTLPNIGATLNWSTGNSSGLTSITYGFLFNGTNDYTGQMLAGGTNDRTSYLSGIAVGATDFHSGFLNGWIDGNGNKIDFWDNAYYENDDRNMPAPWNVIVNAQAGAIANYGSDSDPNYPYRYIAATERVYPVTAQDVKDGNYTLQDGDRIDEDGFVLDKDGNGIYNILLGGSLNQAYGRKVTGSKYDALLNVGLNFSETFFVGANLGITSLNYNFDEYFKEAAVKPDDFLTEFEKGNTYFSDYRTRYSYTVDGSGVYGKFGFLWRPVDGIRVGAAVQTPTVLEINERSRQDVNVNYTDAQYNGSARTPESNYSYRIRSPYRLNAGAAFTFAGMALLSADYEMTDYSTMKFMSKEGGWDSTFDDLNNEIRDCMGVSHMVRIGAEFKPVPELAVRAGYNFTNTPEYVYDGDLKTKLNDRINSFSVGLGYSSNGSFFADIAARMMTLSDEYISPYAEYIEGLYTPMILNKREIYSVTATFGWRF